MKLENRRYIGNKSKLLHWIFYIVNKECKDADSFTDLFAGTGIVSSIAIKYYTTITINDFLYSNNVIYKAFFDKKKYDNKRIDSYIDKYNNLDVSEIKDNYFSKYFGGKYFSNESAKIIGFIREDIENAKADLSDKEYNILIASLLYSVDKIANTVGHYDAYLKKKSIKDNFVIKSVEPLDVKSDIKIYREDANEVAKKIKADIVYIDPPYNSRQYSRFYHVLETLAKWDKPKLHGVALKPETENMSDYCKVRAKDKLAALIKDIDAKYFVLSYNNTYKSKSNSSKNKVTLQEIKNILKSRGETKVYEKEHHQFSSGKAKFDNHKEFLFVTKVEN